MLLVSTRRELDVQAHKSSALAEIGDRGHNRQGRKVAAVPHLRGAGSPSNTMWPGPVYGQNGDRTTERYPQWHQMIQCTHDKLKQELSSS